MEYKIGDLVVCNHNIVYYLFPDDVVRPIKGQVYRVTETKQCLAPVTPGEIRHHIRVAKKGLESHCLYDAANFDLYSHK
jgi:hypothetical protein